MKLSKLAIVKKLITVKGVNLLNLEGFEVFKMFFPLVLFHII